MTESTKPTRCGLCGSGDVAALGVEAFLFPATSYAPEFHEYENYVCGGCGVVFAHPHPDEASLAAHYNNAYRRGDGLVTDDGVIDVPVLTPTARLSLLRAENFRRMIARIGERLPAVIPGPGDRVIDYGAYQGLFLYALSRLWPISGIAYDYNEAGIAFARGVLGLPESRVARDIYTETFDVRPRFVTMVHLLEHLVDPVGFLRHIRDNVLAADGFLYIEVPNLYGIPLCEPTHMFTYTRESMDYLLRRCGYEVVDMTLSGYPPVDYFLCRNDEQNLVCLARPAADPAPADLPPPGTDVEALRRRVRRHYARHTRRGVARQLRTAARETARFAYYLVFALIIDRLSPRLADQLARALGARDRS